MVKMVEHALQQAQPESSTMQSVMVGRQPIYNCNMGIYGYELLFHAVDQLDERIDLDHATAQLINNALLNFGLDNLVADSKAVIKVTQMFLENMDALPFESESVVLSLPADIKVNKVLLESLVQLSDRGFTIAYEGIGYQRQLKSLYKVIDIYKFNVKDLNEKIVHKLLKPLSKFKNLVFQAVGVETMDEYMFYTEMGFSYCQGYFLTKPRVYESKDLPSNSLSVFNLMAAVNDDDTELCEIAKIISQDVSLSYKLLKLINSPFFGVGNEIDSLQQALTLLGRRELKSWVSLMAMTGVDNRPVALMDIALSRARMCEQFAERSAISSDSYFTVGLFSILDQLMERPMEMLLNMLPLHIDVKQAILEQEGNMGKALSCAIACENSDWERVKFKNVSCQELINIYIESIGWANRCLSSIVKTKLQ